MAEGKKKKGQFKKIIPIVIFAVIGAVLGYFAMALTDGNLGIILLAVVSLPVSLYMHIVIHESGHLVMGLFSGYRFVSFRIGNTIWVKQGRRIVRKKYHLEGTGGQCLLDPPERAEDGTFPCLMYNLGGGLFNLLFSSAAILLTLPGWVGSGAVSRAMLIPFAFVGIYLALTNLIPLKVDGLANDGYNIKSFRKNRDSARAFWTQMRMNKMQHTDGLRLCQIPQEFFVFPQGEISDPLIDGVRVFWFGRLLDQQRFAEASVFGRELCTLPGLLAIHKKQVEKELLFIELLGARRPEEIERLYDKGLEKKLKSGGGYPSTYRMLYTYAKLYTGDKVMEEAALAAFEKAIKTYPAPGEILTERELMEIVMKEERP